MGLHRKRFGPLVPPPTVLLVACAASTQPLVTAEAGATETHLSSSRFVAPGGRGVPAPDDTLHVTGTIPYLDAVAGGDAYVYLGAEHTALENPIVVVEGFDIDNSLGANELYELLNQETLLETLRAMGYDAVVLDFTDATDYIQRNAFVLVELLGTVESLVDPALSYPVVGASMGGLVARYALAYMETHAIAHRVHTYLSFDAPHRGANVPLGIQYWLAFFRDESDGAAALLAALDSPAARQMLVYHHTDPPSPTGTADALRIQWEAELSAAGGYPTLTRNVAVANGSGTGMGLGFAPAEQIVEWEYDGSFVDITGNVFAVSDGPTELVFDGLLHVFGSGDEQRVLVGDTDPFDNAPGGTRSSMADMDASEAPFGDIVALHPSHSFVPTISAIDLDTKDLFYPVASDPDAISRTPFQAMYVPGDNEPHVLVTPENKAFVIAEIAPLVAAGDPSLQPARMQLAAAPSPFTTRTHVLVELPPEATASLAVYDVRGRRVATLATGSSVARSRRFLWDGRTDTGHQAPSGVYVVHLHSSGATVARKVVKR